MAAGSRTKNRTSKAEQATATRARIVTAATTLFLRDGFVTSTMAAIANEAGVAVQTLYLAFGSKTAILQAAFDTALKGGHDTDGILESDWFRRVLTEPDGPVALRLFCTEAHQVIVRGASLFEAMRAAAADPEVAELLSHNKGLRAHACRLVADALAARQGFAPSLSAADASVILYTVVSEDSFLLMVTEHKWPAERWLQWTSTTCLTQFFPSHRAKAPDKRPD